MKKFVSVFLIGILMLVMVACESTNPSLKQIWLHAVQKELESTPQEIRTTYKISTNALSLIDTQENEQIPEEVKTFIKLLESGITVDQKIKDLTNIQATITFEDDQPLRELGLWDFEATPSIDIIQKDETVLFKSSTDKHYFSLNDGITTTSASMLQPQMMNLDFQKEFQVELYNIIADFSNDFEYTMEHVSDQGYETIQTPTGEKSVKHIEVVLTFDEIVKIAFEIMDSLENWDGLQPAIAQYMKLVMSQVPEDQMFPVTDEQINQMIEMQMPMIREEIASFKNEMKKGQESPQYQEFLSYFKDTKITYDLYVTDTGKLVKDHMLLELSIPEEVIEKENPEIQVNQPLQIQFDLTNSYIASGADVIIDSPNPASILVLEDILAKPDGMKELDDDPFVQAFLKKMAEYDQARNQFEFVDPEELKSKEMIKMIPTPYEKQ